MNALVFHGPGEKSRDDIIEAYDVFARPAETGALKVVLTRS